MATVTAAADNRRSRPPRACTVIDVYTRRHSFVIVLKQQNKADVARIADEVTTVQHPGVSRSQPLAKYTPGH
jgi:hypothetical protein